jgi:hypothetical protein
MDRKGKEKKVYKIGRKKETEIISFFQKDETKRETMRNAEK